MQPTAPPSRTVPALLAAVGLALAIAIAAGVVGVPDVAAAVSDVTRPLGGWIYLVLMGVVFVETTALLGFVIHGELVLMLGGVAAERGDASLPLLIALVCVAAVAGDVVGLLLGRRLGRPFLERHGARMRLGAAQLERVDGFFERHGGKALFLGRFNGFTRAVMPIAVGSAGVAVRRLLPFSVASAVVWTVTFTVIGYTLAESFEEAGETATRVGLAGILVISAALLLRSRRRPRSAAPASGGGSAIGDRRAA